MFIARVTAVTDELWTLSALDSPVEALLSSAFAKGNGSVGFFSFFNIAGRSLSGR